MPYFDAQLNFISKDDEAFKLIINANSKHHLSKQQENIQYHFISNTYLGDVFYEHWNNLSIGSDTFNSQVYSLFSEIQSPALIIIESYQFLKVVTDPLGFHPIFYRIINDMIFFSSSQRFLVSRLDSNYTWNDEAIASYLHNGHLLSNQCWFNELTRIRPGTIFTFDKLTRDVDSTYYWTWQKVVEKDIQATLGDYINLFRKPLLSLPKNAKKLVSLSGGLDSRWILGTLTNEPHVSAITFADLHSRDLVISEQVCNVTSTEHYIIDLNDSKSILDRLESFYEMDGMVHLGHIHEGNFLISMLNKADIFLNGFYGGGVYADGILANKRVTENISKLFLKGSTVDRNVEDSFYDINHIDPYITDHRIRNLSAYSCYFLSNHVPLVIPFYNMKWMEINYSFDDREQFNSELYLLALIKSISKQLREIPWQKTNVPIRLIWLNKMILKFSINRITERLLQLFNKTSHFINYVRYDSELNKILETKSYRNLLLKYNVKKLNREIKFRVLSLILWQEKIDGSEN